MITTRTLLAGVAGAALLAGIVASNADAATAVSITLIDGQWTAASPDDLATLEGLTTNEIRWGIPVPAGGDKSGYRFDPEATPINLGTVPPPFDPAVEFDIGEFTHFNFPIQASTSITDATLQVTFEVTLDDGVNPPTTESVVSTFLFNHFETPNNADPCADGGQVGTPPNQNGCADRVTIDFVGDLSTAIEIEGIAHIIDIAGFLDPDTNAFSEEFWTPEELATPAILVGRIFAPGQAIPEPASLALLGAGLAGLGVFARRRRLI